MQRSLDQAKIEEDLIAAARFLKNHPSGNGKLGAVGFCFGGYIVNMLAAVEQRVRAIDCKVESLQASQPRVFATWFML